MTFKTLAITACVCFLTIVYGQENNIIKSQYQTFEEGSNQFGQKLYAHSDLSFGEYLESATQSQFGDYEKLRRESILTGLIAGLRIDDPAAENELSRYILAYYPDPVTIQPILELASHYYYAQDYQQVIDWYDKIDISRLPDLDQSEAAFKKGYCQFVKKDFKGAKSTLGQSLTARNIFYYPTNYYYGMSQYFLDDYTGATQSFKNVANSDYYGDFIPYYLCQIYFAQGKMDLLLSYGEQKIMEGNVKNKKNIRRLLGQAYYLRGDYDRALVHLEFYENNTAKLTKEEFYQLGFTQYKLGKFEKAQSNFKELTYLKTKLGQLSNYYLADCLIKSKDKPSARAIFKKVSEMEFDNGMREEATFNYAKISAELGYEREAINIFVDITDASPYYNESQDLIYDILINSGDYDNSIAIMESLPRLTDKLKTTYQNLCLKKGIQHYSDQNFDKSKELFDKSLKYTMQRLYTAQAYYWLGKMSFNSGQLNQTISYLDQYHSVANGLNDLPEESAIYMANYLKAYAFLKQKIYDQAEIQFKNAIVGIDLNSEDIKSQYILNRVQPDAFVRGADCLFKQGKYQAALDFYDRTIQRKQTDIVYSKYQKGIIYGLQNKPYEKIIAMEEITKSYELSAYGDDAHLQIGETYLSLEKPDPAAIAYIDLMAIYGPKSPYFNNAQLKMGLINYNRGDINKALYYYKNVFNHNPNSTQKVEAMKGIEEIYVKDLTDSEAYFEYLDSIPGFEIKDYDRDSLSYIAAYNQFDNGKFEAALISFNSYLQSFPGGFYKKDALYYRGEIHNKNRDYEAALQDYNQLIAFSNNNYYKSALSKAAIITFNYSKDYQRAKELYRKLELIAEDNGAKYASKKAIMESAYQTKDQQLLLDYAGKVNESPIATTDERAVSLFYIGKMAYNTKNEDQALAAFSKVSQMVNDAKAAESKYLLSKIYFDQSKLDLAEKQCNFNNETSLNYPYWVAKSILLLSDIYILKDDLINARAAIEAVIENFGDDEELSVLANQRMASLQTKESDASRIKNDNTELLELDTIGGNE